MLEPFTAGLRANFGRFFRHPEYTNRARMSTEKMSPYPTIPTYACLPTGAGLAISKRRLPIPNQLHNLKNLDHLFNNNLCHV